jgi:hypothetical protein
MTGKPGRSGGKREGAGRPPSTVTVREGQEWLMHEIHPDGVTFGQIVTVRIVGRNRLELLAAGYKIDLLK